MLNMDQRSSNRHYHLKKKFVVFKTKQLSDGRPTTGSLKLYIIAFLVEQLFTSQHHTWYTLIQWNCCWHSIDYAKHSQLEFGVYSQTNEQHDNLMITRKVGAIAVRPSGNKQGGYYWTELLITADVIERIHYLDQMIPVWSTKRRG
jgi:hypothetical protein